MNGIDWLDVIAKAVFALMDQVGPALVPFSLVLVGIFGACGLVWRALMLMAPVINFNHHPHLNIFEIFLYMMKIMGAAWILEHWVVPIPGIGLNFHQLFPYFGLAIAKAIDKTATDQMMGMVHKYMANLEHPGTFNLLQAYTYGVMLLEMALVQFCAFVMSAGGYVFYAIWAIFGPLFVPCILSQRFEGKWWAWCEAAMAFSFFLPISAAISYVYAIVMATFFSKCINGDYSLSMALALLVVLTPIVASNLFAIFLVPVIAGRLWSHSADVAQGFSSSVQSFMTSSVSRLTRMVA